MGYQRRRGNTAPRFSGYNLEVEVQDHPHFYPPDSVDPARSLGPQGFGIGRGPGYRITGPPNDTPGPWKHAQARQPVQESKQVSSRSAGHFFERVAGAGAERARKGRGAYGSRRTTSAWPCMVLANREPAGPPPTTTTLAFSPAPAIAGAGRSPPRARPTQLTNSPSHQLTRRY